MIKNHEGLFGISINILFRLCVWLYFCLSLCLCICFCFRLCLFCRSNWFFFTAAFHFLFQFSQYTQVAQCRFFYFGLNVLDGLFGFIRFYPFFFFGSFSFFYLALLPDAGMRNNDAFFIAVKFNHHELCSFFSADALTIFFCKMTVRSKSFQSIRQLNDSAFIVTAAYRAFMYGSNSKGI